MIALTPDKPVSWLSFELNILRRMDFRSLALPFSGDPAIGGYLKRRDVRVLTNDLLQSNWTNAVAQIQNNSEKLSDSDVNLVLEDVYVPRHKLRNSALRSWFSETDAWWFDNVRQNLERLESPVSFAIAASLVMAVGDYVLSFTEETLELRQPLSNVFRRLWTRLPEPVNNGQNNICANKNPVEFIAENNFIDLMLLRLPATLSATGRQSRDRSVWREEWLRGGDDFWDDVEKSLSGRLGMEVETKSQYLRLLEEALRTASHIEKWVIGHVENGFVSTQEIVERIGRIRRVETVYTKDFSELTGTKAVLITA